MVGISSTITITKVSVSAITKLGKFLGSNKRVKRAKHDSTKLQHQPDGLYISSVRRRRTRDRSEIIASQQELSIDDAQGYHLGFFSSTAQYTRTWDTPTSILKDLHLLSGVSLVGYFAVLVE